MILRSIRRRGLPASALLPALLALLSACGSSPQVQLYQLRADPPGTDVAVPAAARERWALGSVQLPDYLDRDALVLPSGAAGLQTLHGHRWAEPLRDAVPRLLLADLARLRGSAGIWRAPVPPGTPVERELRVEIQRFEADAPGRAVVLAARWMLVDTQGRAPARVFDSRIELPLPAGTLGAEPRPDALVSVHRQALWALAQDIQRRGEAR